MLPKRPAPTPEITNAADGLLQITDSDSSSSLVISPSLNLFAAVDAPNGNPQRLPITNATTPSPLTLKILLKHLPIIESAGKLGIGLGLCAYLLRRGANSAEGAAAAIFGVTVGAALALAFLLLVLVLLY